MQRVIPAFTQFRCAPPPSTVKLGGMFSHASHERRMRLRKGSVVASPRLASPVVASLNIFTLTQLLGVMFFPVWKRVSPLPSPSEDSLVPVMAKEMDSEVVVERESVFVPDTISYPLPEHSFRPLFPPCADDETIEDLAGDDPDEQQPSRAQTPEELMFAEDLYPSASQAAVRQYITLFHARGRKHWRLKDELRRFGYQDDPEYNVTAMSQLYSRMRVFLQRRFRFNLAHWIEEPTRRGYRAVRFRFRGQYYVAIIDFAQRGEKERLEFKAFMSVADFDRSKQRPRLNKPAYKRARKGWSRHVNRRG